MTTELTPWIWHNGRIVPWRDATLHVMAHTIHYGSSAFEGIRCYDTPEGPSLFRLRDHLDRLLDSCRIYRMDPGYDRDTLERACCEVLQRNALREGYLRPLVCRGTGALGILPLDSSIETYLMCWPWGSYLGAEALTEGVDVCVSSWSRPAANTHPALAKLSGNYLNAQLIKMEAVANGFAEGIALTPDGVVSEASAQNLFLVSDGILRTPAVDGSVLRGLTRDAVCRLAESLDIPLRAERVPREALYTADEVFLTGTASEITPVRSVDRLPVGTGTAGPITKQLQGNLLDYVRGAVPDRYGWRTPIAGRVETRVA